MITEIFISYSWWAILVIVALGSGITALLYYNNPLNKLGKTISVILSVFRFLVVTLLLFLLLSPYIRTKNKIIEKPIIIVGVDNSESIILGKDSLNYKTVFTDELKSALNIIGDKADIDYYGFADGIVSLDSLNFEASVSNYSGFIDFVKENYAGQNIGALIIAGDGIYNTGVDPISSISDLSWPVFTIAMGDTIGVPDIRISDIRNNSIVYSQDEFPVEVSVNVSDLPMNMQGESIGVRLLENGKVIGRKKFTIRSQSFTTTLNFMVEASEPGKRRIKVVVDPIANESLLKNNSKDVFVDVLDTRIKILLLAAAPHPDIGAIKESILRNPNFEVQVAYANEFTGNVDDYNMVILYQFPSSLYSASRIINEVVNAELPSIYIIGNTSNFSHYNRLETGLRILPSGVFDIAFPEINSGFSRFVFSESYLDQIQKLPPLKVPLGNYIGSETIDIFAYQELSGIQTEFPMISYYSNITFRNAVFVGEGYWLWRMQSKLLFDNTEAMDAIFSKSIMYLIADIDKRRFKVLIKGTYDFRSDIILRAEYYNEALEPENRNDVELTLTDESGNDFNYLFNAVDNAYVLNLRRLPVGVYSYYAGVVGNDEYTDRGDFIVEKIDLESANIMADHGMLGRMANQNSGKLYFIQDLNEVGADIDGRSLLRSKVHYQDSFIGLNALLISLILLLALISIEWFLRKYFGNY